LNKTSVSEFILLGITNIEHLKIVLFITFFFFYMFILLGNLSILAAVIIDHGLHRPMYFFLANLSCLDLFFSSTTVPKMLAGLMMGDMRISFQSCMVQLYFFHLFGCTEALLLTLMSYDRYIAICNPLRYQVLMSNRVYVQMASYCWVIGFVYSLSHTILTSRLPYCNMNKITHFYCDIKPLLKLACANTKLNERLLTIISGFVSTSTFILVMISYIIIGSHLLNMPVGSKQSYSKAISTCTSHMVVVLLYFGIAMCTYLGPSNKETLEQDRLTALLVTVITPALNPVIYTLRNKEMKTALKR
ncbi:hypothetical protein XENTR_v10022272, partial [Xenopus tropicalis]